MLVIHDIGGMRDWPRALGDQLAQDGFIAIVPDFLSGKGPNGGGSESLGAGVGQAIRTLTQDRGERAAERRDGIRPQASGSNGKVGVVGFCWGGARSFGYAVGQPESQRGSRLLRRAPGFDAPTRRPKPTVAKIKAPVLGLYGGNDNRINSTLPATTAAMKKLGKSYETHIFDGAGHGFLGNQAGAAEQISRLRNKPGRLLLRFLENTCPSEELRGTRTRALEVRRQEH